MMPLLLDASFLQRLAKSVGDCAGFFCRLWLKALKTILGEVPLKEHRGVKLRGGNSLASTGGIGKRELAMAPPFFLVGTGSERLPCLDVSHCPQ